VGRNHDPNHEFFLEAVRGLLKPIGRFLEDDAVSEVLVNGHDEVFVERKGRLERVTNSFPDPASLDAAALNIAQFVGRPLDREHPILDARLPDGSRVHVVLPPVSRQGTVLSIRRFSRTPLSAERLVELGTITWEALALLRAAVLARRNIIIAGGTGSGKTSLLNSLATMIPGEERILVIEDSSELQLTQPHKLCMEAQTGDEDGHGKVTISDLFRSSLRLRPDRIIIGEVRGEEALDMIQAMTSGHSGSIATTHAETPGDTLRRLETLALYRGLQLPQYAVRAQVASAIHLVVIIGRQRDGHRRVVEISEICGLDGQGDYQITPLFRWRTTGVGQDGVLQGALEATGFEARLYDDARQAGYFGEGPPATPSGQEPVALPRAEPVPAPSIHDEHTMQLRLTDGPRRS
jgi:pilus assembly protein CpaF